MRVKALGTDQVASGRLHAECRTEVTIISPLNNIARIAQTGFAMCATLRSIGKGLVRRTYQTP